MQRRPLLAMALAAGTGVARAQAANPQPTDDPQTHASWQWARSQLFAGRTLQDAPPGALVLDAPVRATDAAVVPIAIRARPPAPAVVKRLVLVIDANPSPIAAVFDLAADAGRAEVETRVRVDGYSFLHAVAELQDGRLWQTHRFVKASGGCSAPPGTDPRAALATMGRMAWRVEGDAAGREPVLLQLAIQHPNHSGMAMDQATRQFTPAHFVRRVSVSADGRPLLTADVNFSISENPSFRFWFTPRGAAELRAEVEDSQGLKFTAAHALRSSAT